MEIPGEPCFYRFAVWPRPHALPVLLDVVPDAIPVRTIDYRRTDEVRGGCRVYEFGDHRQN